MKKSVKDAFYTARAEELDEFLKEIEAEGGIAPEVTSRIKKRVEEKTGVGLIRRKPFFKPWIAAVACLCIAVAVSLSVEYLDFDNNRGVIPSGEELQSQIASNDGGENSDNLSTEELTSSYIDLSDESTLSKPIYEDDEISNSVTDFGCEGFFPSGVSGEIKIIYGKDIVPKDVGYDNFSGVVNLMFLSSGSETPEENQQDEAERKIYYYVCIDARGSKVYSEDVLVNIFKAVGIKTMRLDNGVFVSAITSEQISSLKKQIDERGEDGLGIRLSCVAKDFVEEWTSNE